MSASKPPQTQNHQSRSTPSFLYHAIALIFSLGLSGYLVHVYGDSELRLVQQWASFTFTQPDRPIPPQSYLIDPKLRNVLGENGPFRDVITPLNPSNAATPHFQIWNPTFLDILGPHPAVKSIVRQDDFAFAHEAPVYDPIEQQIFFSNLNGNPLGRNNWTHNNKVFRIKLKDIYQSKSKNVNIPFEEVPINPPVQMVNGGTPFGKNILLVGSGRANIPPHLSLVNPRPPYNSTVILDNVNTRQFNSLNDAKVHPKSGAVFFTDTIYGYVNDFRPLPLLPSQVYRFDAATGEVRVVADGFDKCNGIAFSPDGRIAYIADSGACIGHFNSTLPAMVYAFDVDLLSQTFLNRRVLAWIDTGVPDGIQVDSKGNVYVSCGDGVQVFNPQGVLLGKIFTGMISANLVFAGHGRMIILSETEIFLAEIAATSSLTELE